MLAARDGQGQVVLDEGGRPVLARPAALVRAYEAREPNSEGVGAITMGDLTRQSLRDSPDVVVIGETRGPEMVHILDALTNGISGVMASAECETRSAWRMAVMWDAPRVSRVTSITVSPRLTP